MLQLGSELDFPKEAIGAEGGGEFGMQYLQRYQSGVPKIVRQVDRGHSAAAEFALDPIAVTQRRQEGSSCGHAQGSGTGL
jgi:hypothetical protein